jgi:Asp-tRNA(Asn)/Glu-tRNA(Gln) amidotransferase A subunit family amidase
LNPFDRRVTAGGSSGGAAAAVAAGFALAAIGTDTGGSIRTPASFNGLVGVRPTHGLIDPSGVAPLAPSTDTVGALTRSVSDARRLLEVLAGGRYADIGLDLSAVRVGAFRQAFGKDPIIVAAVEAVLSRVSALGATILDPMLLPEPLLDFSGDHIVDWEFCQAFDHYLSKNFISGAPESVASILASGEFLPEYRDTLRKRLGLGGLDNPIYRGVLASHERLTNGLSELFRAHGLDALVYPTSIVVPSSLDNPKGGWAPELAARSGRPAITLPVAQADTGIPIGLELLGGRHEEAALLNLAAGFERVIGRRFLPLT